MTDPVQLLRELVALPSVNPAFLPAGDSLAGEARVGQYFAAVAAHAGLDVELRPALPGRPNVLIRLTPPGRIRRRILLAPHLDTIPPADPGQMDPRLAGRRLYGRGACDAKGCAAAMLAALMDLAQSATRPRQTEITLAGLVDEEKAQGGSRALAAQGFRADLAIVGEPTRLRVVTAHKGDLWLRFAAAGRAAHGSRPELGRNAILAMARATVLLETEYALELRRRRHLLLGPATINCGVIAGGRQPNVVPDHCELVADRRTLPGETAAGIRRALGALLRRHGLALVVRPENDLPCPALETDPGLPLVREFCHAAGVQETAGVDFFCDAAILAGGGIPAIVFGPGDIAQAHTRDEWIGLASLARAHAIYRRFLTSQP